MIFLAPAVHAKTSSIRRAATAVLAEQRLVTDRQTDTERQLILR